MTLKTVLIYPPQAVPFQPYSSLPSLAGFLRTRGYDVELYDANVQAYVTLLTPDRLRYAESVITKQLRSLEIQDSLSEAEKKQAEALVKAQVVAPYIIDHIEEAHQIIRDPEQFYDLARCSWAHSVLTRGLELLSAEYYPTQWGLTELKMRAFTAGQKPGPRLAALLQAARDEKENVFLAFLREKVLPSILDTSPGLVGLSVTYPAQIIPALTLADLIKQAAPAIHICVGGARVCYDRLWTQKNVFSIIDSVIVGEGEHALLALVQKLERGDPELSSVPNLIYLRDDEVVRSTETHLEDVNELPTPDWRGLPLEDYFAPAFIPMLPTTRGCYWGRCAFCTVSQATSCQYRPRRMDLVLQDMQTLYERHGAIHFFLSCDAEPPKRMEALATGIKDRGWPFIWQTETRFHPPLTKDTCQLLFEGGCRYLIFGLESACQRVLDWMEKGTQVTDFGDVLRHCYQAGIAVNLQAFMGFPTETKEEARMTADFMLEHNAYIESIAVGSFQLQPRSKVECDPDRYGVTYINRETETEADVILAYDYEVNQGMAQHEVPEQVRRAFVRLGKVFANPPAITSILNTLLYVMHYGVRSLQEQKRARYLDLNELLNSRPQASEGLLRHEFSFNGEQTTRTILFNPVNGEFETLDAQGLQLLNMCDGQRSIDQIATELASRSNTTVSFAVGYAQALNHLKMLCENKFLDIARQKCFDAVLD